MKGGSGVGGRGSGFACIPSRRGFKILAQELGEVSLSDEADAHRLVLGEHVQSTQSLGHQRTHLGLAQVTQGKYHILQALSLQVEN